MQQFCVLIELSRMNETQDWTVKLTSRLAHLPQFSQFRDVIPIISQYVGVGDALLCYNLSGECHLLHFPSASQIWGSKQCTPIQFQQISGWNFKSRVLLHGSTLFGIRSDSGVCELWNIRTGSKTKVPNDSGLFPLEPHIHEDRVIVCGRKRVADAFFLSEIVQEFDIKTEKWLDSRDIPAFGHYISCVTNGSLLRLKSAGNVGFFEVIYYNLASKVSCRLKLPWPCVERTTQPHAMFAISDDLVLVIGRRTNQLFHVLNSSTASLSSLESGFDDPNIGWIRDSCLLALPETNNQILALSLTTAYGDDKVVAITQISISDHSVSLSPWCIGKLPFQNCLFSTMFSTIPADLVSPELYLNNVWLVNKYNPK